MPWFSASSARAGRSDSTPGRDSSSARRSETRADSSCSTMAFTGPTDAGAIEISRKPSPISAIASRGLLPISPQTVTGHSAAAARFTMSFKALSEAGLRGSNRFATRRFSRSAAKRYCMRSFEPTERKSAALAMSSISNRSEGTSIIAPSSTDAGGWRPWRARYACSRLTTAFARANSSHVATIGNITFSRRPAAAFKSSRIWLRSRPGRSSEIRIARQPSVEDLLIELLLLAAGGHALGDHELQLGAEKADAARPGLLKMGQVDEQAGVEVEADLEPILGAGRQVPELAVLLLPARTEARLCGVGGLD